MYKTANESSAVSSKAVPDVLFVDEDGNPIEAGNENLLYFDENGHELPEEIAQQLLETGKYFDSREYYQSMSCTESQVAFSESATNNAARVAQPPPSSSSYSRHESKSNHYLQQKTSSSDVAQAHAIALAEAQARIFAEAQLQLRRREEELAQIEADANRESSRLKELIDQTTFQQQQLELQKHIEYQLQLQQQQKKLEEEYSKSLSNTDVEKSQSLRRIPMPPPKKTNDASDASFSYSQHKLNHYAQVPTKSGNSVYSGQSSHAQQVFDLAELITGNMSPRDDERRDGEEEEVILQANNQSKYASTDDEDYAYQPATSTQNEAYHHLHEESVDYRDQQIQQQQQQQPQHNQYYSRTESNHQQHQQQQQQQQQIEQMLFAEHLQQTLHQQDMEQLELKRKQQEIIDQVLKIDQSRPTSGLYMSDGGVNESVSSAVNVTEYEAVQHALAKSASALASQAAASTTAKSNTLHEYNNNDETIITVAESHKSQNQTTSVSSTTTRPYKLGTLKLVGHLRGADIIRDSSRIYELDLKDLEKYYEAAGNSAGDETLQHEDGEDFDGEKRQQQQHDSDPFGADPFSADLFKDEMIELDYGAIDAYTASLNAHLNAERNNEPEPTGLRYASHILTSNHAMFLENQMFLGDAYFSTGISREVSLLNTREKEVVNGGALRNPSRSSTGTNKQQGNARTSQSNVSQAQYEHDTSSAAAAAAAAASAYSRSNSYRSGIDLQSQLGASTAYCVSSANLNNRNQDGSIGGVYEDVDVTNNFNNNSNLFSAANFSSKNLTQQNLTQSHYRSPSSNYLNASANYLNHLQNRNAANNLKSSSTNIKASVADGMATPVLGATNSRVNYTLDSHSGYNHGYYTGGKSSNTNMHTSHSGIYTMSNLIAQYGQ